MNRKIRDQSGSIEDWPYVHDPPWWVADLNGSFRSFSWDIRLRSYFSTDWPVEHPLGSRSKLDLTSEVACANGLSAVCLSPATASDTADSARAFIAPIASPPVLQP